MNLLALVAVLGAVGMVAVAKWYRHSKTAEATHSVEAIATGAATYYGKSDFTQPAGSKPEALKASRHFPPPSSTSVPADVGDVQGKLYKSAAADWAGSPWRDIGFALHQPQSYAYSFESEGAGPGARCTAVARGDLDGNGVWSSYRLGVIADESGTARVGTTLEKINPEE
jgi:hypothetical protein